MQFLGIFFLVTTWRDDRLAEHWTPERGHRYRYMCTICLLGEEYHQRPGCVVADGANVFPVGWQDTRVPPRIMRQKKIKVPYLGRMDEEARKRTRRETAQRLPVSV